MKEIQFAVPGKLGLLVINGGTTSENISFDCWVISCFKAHDMDYQAVPPEERKCFRF